MLPLAVCVLFEIYTPVSYTHLDVYKRQLSYTPFTTGTILINIYISFNTVVNIENKVLQLLPVARGNLRATLRTNNDH